MEEFEIVADALDFPKLEPTKNRPAVVVGFRASIAARAGEPAHA